MNVIAPVMMKVLIAQHNLTDDEDKKIVENSESKPNLVWRLR